MERTARGVSEAWQEAGPRGTRADRGSAPPLWQQFEDPGSSLSAADAHGDHCVARLAPLHFAQNGGRQFGPRAAQRMAQRDGSAIPVHTDRKSTRLNSSHLLISYAVFCLKK